MKKCSKCNEEKDLENFGKDKIRKDGLNPYCKECLKKRYEEIKVNDPQKLKKWRQSYNARHRLKIIDYQVKYLGENREKVLASKRESYEKNKIEIAKRRAIKRRTEEGREKARQHGKKSRDKTGNAIKYVTKWRKANPHKSAVHIFVLWAVRVGVMKKPDACEQCGKIWKIQAHHENYEKPMDVNWLCSVCHGEKHRKI
jgi:hypothetical protein